MSEILTREVQAYVDKIDAIVPQAPMISPERKVAWVNAVLSFEKERIDWHIRRLTGLGGSEIGTVVAPAAKQYDPFSTPRDVYMAKMMITLPEPPNGHMKRGTFMEDEISRIFRNKYKLQADEAALKVIGSYRDPKHPWRVGNPDDYGVIGRHRFMVDYKCPMPGFSDKYDLKGISFGYTAQLHHYTQIARDNGIVVDGMLLCSFDMGEWDVDVRRVHMDENLFRLMDEAGDWLWNDCIMRGVMPELPSRPMVRLDGDDPVETRIREILERMSRLTAVANIGYGKLADLKKELALLFESRRIGSDKLIHDVMSISATQELNTDRATEALKKFGLNPRDFMREGPLNVELLLQRATEAKLNFTGCYTPELDQGLVVNVLSEKGYDPLQLMDEKVTAEATRAKKGEIGERFAGIKAEASVCVDQFVTAGLDQAFVQSITESNNRKPGM